MARVDPGILQDASDIPRLGSEHSASTCLVSELPVGKLQHLIDHSGLKVIDAHVLQNGHHHLHNKWTIRSECRLYSMDEMRGQTHLCVFRQDLLFLHLLPLCSHFSKRGPLKQQTNKPGALLCKYFNYQQTRNRCKKIFVNCSGSGNLSYHISFDLTGVLNGSSAEKASEKFPLPRHDRQQNLAFTLWL